MSRILGLLGALCLVAACDPYAVEGTWRPTGANEANLRSMAARPADFAVGQGDPGGEGHRAATAVERLREGRTLPLLESGVAQIGPTGGGGGSGQ